MHIHNFLGLIGVVAGTLISSITDISSSSPMERITVTGALLFAVIYLYMEQKKLSSQNLKFTKEQTEQSREALDEQRKSIDKLTEAIKDLTVANNLQREVYMRHIDNRVDNG